MSAVVKKATILPGLLQIGYGLMLKNYLKKKRVNAYFLEFDTERAGGFEPLAKVTPGKKVVLGLLTSKVVI